LAQPLGCREIGVTLLGDIFLGLSGRDATKEKKKAQDADRDSTVALNGILSTVTEPPVVLVSWSS
jgi:hypothetical protein